MELCYSEGHLRGAENIRHANQTPPLEAFIDVLWWLREHFGTSDWEVFATAV